MIIPVENAVLAEETTVQFVLYDDGSTARIETTGGAVPVLPNAGTFVPEALYLARLAVLEEETAAYLAGLEAADKARSLADYVALTALGLPEETARRLSGHFAPDLTRGED